MRRIETTLVVMPNGQASLKVPDEIEPGEHPAVVIIGKAANHALRPQLELPSHDVGPWPDGFRVRREEIYGDFGR